MIQSLNKTVFFLDYIGIKYADLTIISSGEYNVGFAGMEIYCCDIVMVFCILPYFAASDLSQIPGLRTSVIVPDGVVDGAKCPKLD